MRLVFDRELGGSTTGLITTQPSGAFHWSELAGQTGLKDKCYPSPWNFFKIAPTILGVIIYQDFASPSLQYDTFDLQTGQSGRTVLASGKHSSDCFQRQENLLHIVPVLGCTRVCQGNVSKPKTGVGGEGGDGLSSYPGVSNNTPMCSGFMVQ